MPSIIEPKMQAAASAGAGPSGALPCSRQAYVGLLTTHDKHLLRDLNVTAGKWKTFIGKKGGKFDTQVLLLQVLLRSLRAAERACRRDFVLLLGPQTRLPPDKLALLRAEGVVTRPAPPLRAGVPTLDKLHAWRLTNYSRVLFVDSDVMAFRSLDDLFRDDEQRLPELAIAAHPYVEMMTHIAYLGELD